MALTQTHPPKGTLPAGVKSRIGVTTGGCVDTAAELGQLRSVFDTFADGVAVLTTEARFVQLNKAFCAMTGYSEPELAHLDCVAVIHPDDGAAMTKQIQDMLSGATPSFTIKNRLLRKSGEVIWVQHSVSLTRDANSRPASVIAFCQNITEPWEAQRTQRAREAQLAAELADSKLLREISAQLVEQGNEQALNDKIVDVVAMIMRSDFATMQMFYPRRGLKGELQLLASRGLTPEGRKLWEWVRFDTDSTCGQALRSGVRSIAADVESSEFLAGTAGGAALLGAGIRAAQSTPLFSRSGKLVGMISSHWSEPHSPSERDLRLLDILARQAADLIERRRGEDELRRVNHDLEQFAHSAGHDLQEPLRTITIYSELLRARCTKTLDDESITYLGFLGSAATRMQMLVRDLLAYAEVDKMPAAEAQMIDAGAALGHALANLRGTIEDCSAEISFDRLPEVCINESHLIQLFQNLIGNAVKYRVLDGRCIVHVWAEHRDGFLVFSVRDNGVGIDEKYQERIFRLFTRLDGKDPRAGTGLGLAICKRIVERYHGRIWVESQLGTGSAFRFSLPS
jgi:PAS domain S-box-containing protein